MHPPRRTLGSRDRTLRAPTRAARARHWLLQARIRAHHARNPTCDARKCEYHALVDDVGAWSHTLQEDEHNLRARLWNCRARRCDAGARSCAPGAGMWGHAIAEPSQCRAVTTPPARLAAQPRPGNVCRSACTASSLSRSRRARPPRQPGDHQRLEQRGEPRALLGPGNGSVSLRARRI
jgi:hypothetical protein